MENNGSPLSGTFGADVPQWPGRCAADLIAEAARLHGLLSLRWDETVSTLFVVLPPGAGRVVLDDVTHAPYLYRGGT